MVPEPLVPIREKQYEKTAARHQIPPGKTPPSSTEVPAKRDAAEGVPTAQLDTQGANRAPMKQLDIMAAKRPEFACKTEFPDRGKDPAKKYG